MNRRRFAQDRLRYALQSAGFVASLLGLLALTGWAIAGPVGLAWTLAAGAGLVVAVRSGRAHPALGRLRPIAPWEAPELHALLAELARRADLPRPPALYLLRDGGLNAMAFGTAARPSVAVTAGLVRSVGLRELAGILAHEVTHLRRGDVWLMTLAGLSTGLQRVMTTFGQILLLVNLPLVVVGAAHVPWALVLVLLVGPPLAQLLQLGLSRTREFDADLGAAELTGDPLGLAAALQRVEGAAVHPLLRLLGVQPPRVPDVFRTHPDTAERVRRLVALAERAPAALRARPAAAPPSVRWPAPWPYGV